MNRILNLITGIDKASFLVEGYKGYVECLNWAKDRGLMLGVIE